MRRFVGVIPTTRKRKEFLLQEKESDRYCFFGLEIKWSADPFRSLEEYLESELGRESKDIISSKTAYLFDEQFKWPGENSEYNLFESMLHGKDLRQIARIYATRGKRAKVIPRLNMIEIDFVPTFSMVLMKYLKDYK